jgi:hypothetical protein
VTNVPPSLKDLDISLKSEDELREFIENVFKETDVMICSRCETPILYDKRTGIKIDSPAVIISAGEKYSRIVHDQCMINTDTLVRFI